MLIKSYKKNGIYTVMLYGDIDHSTSKDIKTYICDGISKHKTNKLILDFSNVSFMDSSGIGMIIGRYKEMKLIQGEIILTGIKKTTEKIINVSGLHKILKVFKSLDEGFNYYNKEN